MYRTRDDTLLPNNTFEPTLCVIQEHRLARGSVCDATPSGIPDHKLYIIKSGRSLVNAALM